MTPTQTLKQYSIEYKDWASGDWFGMGAGPGYGARDIWAHSETEAVAKAREKFGSRGKSYRATLVKAAGTEA